MEDNTSVSKPKKTPVIPTSSVNFLSLAEAVSNKWTNSPSLTMQWISSADFANMVTQFKTSLNSRIEAGNNRKPQTQILKNLDVEVAEAVEDLKVAIQYKFGKKDAQSYYPMFGIVKQKSAYRLPNDRNERIKSLESLVSNMSNYKIKVTGYPDAFFQNALSQYKSLMNEVQNQDGTISSQVGNMGELREKITTVLNSLIHIIKGNYPYTYQNELRSWGFQKEKY
jgi:hypothetical protein